MSGALLILIGVSLILFVVVVIANNYAVPSPVEAALSGDDPADDPFDLCDWQDWPGGDLL